MTISFTPGFVWRVQWKKRTMCKSLDFIMPLVMLIDIQGVVPENIHTPPTEGIENSSQRPKNVSKLMYEAWLEFPERWGGGGSLSKNPSRGGGMDNINFGTTQSSFLRIGHVPANNQFHHLWEKGEILFHGFIFFFDCFWSFSGIILVE